MWVMLNDAWLSIVADNNDQDFLLVRSRQPGCIARIFGVDEFTDFEADYFYRAFVNRDHVAGVLAREVQRVDYPNFKNSVKDPSLKLAYTKTWNAGYTMQHQAQLEGVQRRRAQPIITASDEVDVCSWCQEEIDHCFHAPEMGQPVDVCEDCWRQHGKESLNAWYQDQEEDDQEEGGEETQLSLVN